MGGGHVGSSYLAAFSAAGWDAYGISRSGFPLEDGEITAEGEIVGRFRPVATARSVSELLDRFSLPDYILPCCPATELARYLHELAPFIDSRHTIINTVSARLDDLFAKRYLINSGVSSDRMPKIGTTMSTCFTSRRTNGAVRLLAGKGSIGLWCESSTCTSDVISQLSSVLPMLSPATSSLSLAIDKLQEITHWPVTGGIFADLANGIPRGYYTSISTATGYLGDILDAERVAVAECLGVSTLPLTEVQRIEYGVEGSNFYEAISGTQEYESIIVKDFFTIRTIEDCLNGITLQSIARVSGVKTPMLDSFLTIFSAMLQSRNIFMPQGWRIQDMLPEAKSAEDIRRLVG